MRKQESKLTSAYYDIKGVGSFGGIQALAKKTKVKRKQIKEWLESQDAYTLHKQVRYRFPRRKTIVSGPNQQWQADLIDVSKLSSHNRGLKKSSPSWKGRVHNLPHLCWQITAVKS